MDDSDTVGFRCRFVAADDDDDDDDQYLCDEIDSLADLYDDC